MWQKNANSGYGFVHRKASGHWSVLESLSWSTEPEGLCTVTKLRQAAIPASVRKDFVKARVCYR